MRETTHRPKIETPDMDATTIGNIGMAMIQTAALLALCGLGILMFARLL